MTDLIANPVKPELLEATDWQRYRDIRIASLISDPDAFGGNFDQIMQQTQLDWQSKFQQLTPVVAVLSGADIALMTIENLVGDFGTTCWIGGCWVAPQFRGQGVMRKLFEFVDSKASEKSWQIQGLGVWVTNYSAIKAYQAIGFESKGDPVPSSSKPGMFYQRMIRKVEN